MLNIVVCFRPLTDAILTTTVTFVIHTINKGVRTADSFLFCLEEGEWVILQYKNQMIVNLIVI